MSIIVHIKRFKTLIQKNPVIIQIEFRNAATFTLARNIIDSQTLLFNEIFIWNLDTKLKPGETLIVSYIEQKTCTLEHVVGVYRLGLQSLSLEKPLHINDPLVDDETNCPCEVYIEMTVFCIPDRVEVGSPEQQTSVFLKQIESPHLKKLVQVLIRGQQVLHLPELQIHRPVSRSLAVARQDYASRRALTDRLPSSTGLNLSPRPRRDLPSRPSGTSIRTLARSSVFSETPELLGQQRLTLPKLQASSTPTSPFRKISPNSLQYDPYKYAFHRALIMKYPNPKSSLQKSPTKSDESSQSSAVQSKTDTNKNDLLLEIEQNIADFEKLLKEHRERKGIKDSEDIILSTPESTLKRDSSRILKSNLSDGDRLLRASLEKKQKSSKTNKLIRSFKKLFFGFPKRDDEEEGLLDIAAGGFSDDAATSSHPSVSAHEGTPMQEPIRAHTSLMNPEKMCNFLESARLSSKAGDFQICINIIEARQLPGDNVDPVVVMQVGDIKKRTSVKKSTNCPVFNESFVFDLHMLPAVLMKQLIVITVYHSRPMSYRNKLIGNFKLDVATVWCETDHQFYHEWVLLTDPKDNASGPKGYLKCDICVIRKGDHIINPPTDD